MFKHLLMVLSILTLSGCAITYTQEPINTPSPKEKICIRHNPKTRAGFERVMREWLRSHRYQVRVLPEYSGYNACNWVLTYYGRWSWDLYIYLSEAEISAYHKGNYAGYSRFYVKGKSMNMSLQKYGSADTRVREMMDRLFYR